MVLELRLAPEDTFTGLLATKLPFFGGLLAITWKTSFLLPVGATGFVFPFSGAALHLPFCEVDFDLHVGPGFAFDFADTNIDFLFLLDGDAINPHHLHIQQHNHGFCSCCQNHYPASLMHHRDSFWSQTKIKKLFFCFSSNT